MAGPPGPVARGSWNTDPGIGAGYARKPFGVNVLLSGPRLPFPVQAVVDLCLEEQVPVLSTFLGRPDAVRSGTHAAGVKVIDQVGSVADARRLARREGS
jgi:hypothetical protein